MTHPPPKSFTRVPRSLLTLTEQFVACLVACRIHEPTHPRVAASLNQIREALQELRTETGDQAFTLTAQGETLLFQGRTPIPQNISAARLVEVLRRWRATGLQIHADIPEGELGTMFRILPRTPDHVVGDATAVNRALVELGVMAVRLVPGRGFETDPAGPQGAAMAAHVSRTAIEAVIDGVEVMFTELASGQGIDLARMRRSAESLLTSLDAAGNGADTIDLGQQPDDDPLLVLHSLRCCGLAMLAARGLTRDQDTVLRIGTAALVHDIGKLRLPLHLISLEGEDAENEDAVLREHPVVGAELLLREPDVDPLLLDVVFGHHKTLTGLGFPDTPHDHRPSHVTQLVRIVDLFESLTARRGTRPPMTPTRAWRVLGTHRDVVDPGLLRRVVEAIGIWPLGATVRLTSGETGRVVKPTRDPAAPVVRVDTAGTSNAKVGGLLDLSRQRGNPAQIAGLATITP